MKTRNPLMASLASGVYLLCAALASAPAAALTLDQATARAVAENPGLAEMQARYEALVQVAPQKASLPDPVLNLAAMNLPWNSLDLDQEPMTQLQVGVSQQFPFPGKLGLHEEVALLEAQAALNSVAEMRLKLVRNVAMSWWEVYFLDRSLETVESNKALLRQFVEVATTKYEVGKGRQQDVLLAQLEVSRQLDQEIRIQGLREQQAIRLNLLMGVAPEAAVALPAQLSLTPPGSPRGLQRSIQANTPAELATDAELYQRAAQARPALRAKESLLAVSQSRVELAELDHYPDFKFGVAWGERRRDPLGNSRADFVSLMLSVNIPLYAANKQSRSVQQRSREMAKSRYALLDERNQVRSDIARAGSDYRRASNQSALFQGGIIPQARQTVASMLAGYQVDQVDFLNLVRSQLTLLNYELQYWKAVIEANQALARLQAAVGEENIYE